SEGVFLRDASGSFTLIAETGQAAPGVPGGVFASNFEDLVLNDAGDVMFTANLEIGVGGVDSSNNLGLWYYHGGALMLVGREGSQAPGAAPGELFTNNPTPLLGRRGGAGFSWAARDPGGPLAAPPGLWSVDTGGVVGLVVRAGDPAPGFLGGETIGTFNGRRVIGPGLFGYGATVVPVPGLTAIWEEDDTTVEVRIAGGDPVPGGGGTVTFSGPSGIQAVNFESTMAFRTGLNNHPIGGNALVSQRDGDDPVLVAIRNDVAPGASGATFNSLATIPFVVNGQGEVAFLAGVSGGLNGLWTNTGGTLHNIVLEGQPAPGFSGDPFQSFFQFSAQGLHLNDRGELIFYGLVNGQLHLFHAATDGTVSLIFERDQDFEISPGDTRTLTGFFVHEGEDAHDLPRRSLNTAGQLLVRLSFNNSTRSGLWLSGIPAPLTDPISYAALGDSYSSGEGAPPYFAGTDEPVNECHRSTRAYATQLRTPGNSRSLFELTQSQPGFEWDFLACSGAEADNVSSAGVGIYNEPPQLDASNNVDASRDLVTVSIGGNDAFFSWILVLCLVHEACHTWEPFEPLTEQTFEELFPLLASYAKVKAQAVHAEIRAATPNAPTVVVGYPQVLGGRECLDVGIPPVNLSAEEQAFMRSATTLLNTRLAESAAEVGVHFVPAESHFAGHGACGNKDDWIHGILPFTPVSSFHPKVRGQIEFSRLINDYFEDLQVQGWGPGFFATGLPRNPDPMPGAPLGGAGPVPTFGDLDVVADPPAVCETKDVYVPAQSIRVSGSGFAGSESVSVRLKAGNDLTPFALGSLTADGGGAIDGVVTLPGGVVPPVYATLEVLGAGPSGVGHLLVKLIRVEASFSTDTDTD
ncbi:MAG: SGNH/GDSL hydrolase family protein, partial [Acidobacteriota bacterium]|nr:SGNH/GDSL hydrolase family protein [Acidobacteriota bacterium]